MSFELFLLVLAYRSSSFTSNVPQRFFNFLFQFMVIAVNLVVLHERCSINTSLIDRVTVECEAIKT